MAALVLSAFMVLASATPGGAEPLRGINLSGAELGPDKLPGKPDTDYFYPSGDELARWAATGMNAVRLPVLWERLQPKFAGPLDKDEVARLQSAVREAGAHGLTTIVDLHDYGAYRGTRVGEPAVPARAFADFWARLARVLPLRDVAYGLMNEPNGIGSVEWAAAEQQAIIAIRGAGARALILVSGTGWDGAHNFVSGRGYGESNAVALASLHDPADNMAVELHQYFDADHSGTHAECAEPGDATALLTDATDWLRAHRMRGFLGEFGVSRSPGCLAALSTVLDNLDRNQDVWLGWTYWAGGRWWGDYMFSAEPRDGREPPQLAVLRRHLRRPA